VHFCWFKIEQKLLNVLNDCLVITNEFSKVSLESEVEAHLDENSIWIGDLACRGGFNMLEPTAQGGPLNSFSPTEISLQTH
jgi:hypothetical protein